MSGRQQWRWGETGRAIQAMFALLIGKCDRVELPHWAVRTTDVIGRYPMPGLYADVPAAAVVVRCGCRLLRLGRDGNSYWPSQTCDDYECPITSVVTVLTSDQYRDRQDVVFVFVHQPKPRRRS